MFCAAALWESGLSSPEQTDQTSVLGSALQWRCDCVVVLIFVCGGGGNQRALYILGNYSITELHFIPQSVYTLNKIFPLQSFMVSWPLDMCLHLSVSVMSLGATTSAEVAPDSRKPNGFYLSLLSPSIACKTRSNDGFRMYGFGDRTKIKFQARRTIPIPTPPTKEPWPFQGPCIYAGLSFRMRL
jgi:hypothetical protein